MNVEDCGGRVLPRLYHKQADLDLWGGGDKVSVRAEMMPHWLPQYWANVFFLYVPFSACKQERTEGHAVQSNSGITDTSQFWFGITKLAKYSTMLISNVHFKIIGDGIAQ